MIQRTEKVNELIRQETGKLILKEVDISRETLITVTRAETSPDLKNATVYITVLPETKEQETLKEVKFKAFDIQQWLNKTLRIKFVPRIEFKIDKQAHAEQRIYELMDKENE